MRDVLFTFQEEAKDALHSKISRAHMFWSDDEPQVISFSAPTGAGKTIIMTALFEDIFTGTADVIADPDSIFVWLSDSPELNAQTRLKVESKSDKLRAQDLVTIESTFDAEELEYGHIYFLNTQKLGSDKLLTAKRDKRTYTIWETLTNTAKHRPKQLYIIIDEAHRGTAQSTQEANKAQSIMQKFIKGSAEDGLCIMPLVIGVTATPEKFNRLVEGTTSTVQKVPISPDKVRESGLLKDRIILAIPTTTVTADMSTFGNAIDNWMEKCSHWNAYYDPERQEDRKINPILVIQVEDGSSSEATRTDISACICMIEEKLGRQLVAGEAVHTFNDYGNIPVGDLVIRQIDASRIEEDEKIKVVFFKMNLSTGWDCPRAETMMSFRGAQDATYIAQLLGRMIRTPLARRIKTDAFLNDVSLYLPHFDKKTAEEVIKALRDNEAVYPGEVGTDKEFITLKQNPAFADVFAGMTRLVTYQIDTNRKQAYLRLFMNIARNLTMDGIEPTAQRNAKNAITAKMEGEIARIKASGNFDEIRSNLTGFKMGTMTFGYGDTTYVYDENAGVTETIEYDIARHFDQAGKILGEGLHREYWGKHADEDHIDVKIDVIVLANDVTAMDNLSSFAEAEFVRLYEENSRAISQLSDARKAVYDRMIHASAQPIPTPWILPASIDFTLSEGAEAFDKHLYCREDGSFATNLNPWESGVVHEELDNGAVCWLRNLDRKNWALEIPYEVNGVATPMYPDLLIVRVDTYGYIYDVLEPHDDSRKDNCPKAVGLAKFADKHHDAFGRIQLIREKTGPDGHKHFYRLDMSKVTIRNKVRGITTNAELDRIFDDEGVLI